MQAAEKVLASHDGDFLEVLRGVPIGELTATADTFIDGRDAPGRNMGDREWMGCTLTRDAALIKFDVSAIDRPIERATLKCYCHSVWWRQSRPVAVFETGKDWDETEVTWRNRPRAGSQLVGGKSYDIPGWWAWESDGLTDYVEKCRRGDGIVSLGLDHPGGGLYGATSGLHYGVRFRTKEHDEAKAPKLDLVPKEAPPSEEEEEAKPWYKKHAKEIAIGGAVLGLGYALSR